MKILILLPFLFIFQSVLISQTSIGHIVTAENETIEMYKRTDKKKFPAKMEQGCDCQKYGRSSIVYLDKEGKAKSIDQSDLKKVFIKKGTIYCHEISTVGSGIQRSGALTIETPKDMEMIALPVKKKGKAIALQTVVFSSSKYMLTLFH